jgi:hypothetical protein
LNLFIKAGIAAYQALYVVKKGTAILDLKQLVEKDLLTKKKQGRNVHYYPTKKVKGLFSKV